MSSEWTGKEEPGLKKQQAKEHSLRQGQREGTFYYEAFQTVRKIQKK